MSADVMKRRFIQEIKLRAYEDEYVDRKEEKEILKLAIELNANFDAARQALRQVCESEGYVLESAVIEHVKHLIDTFSGNDGKVDEKEFNDAVSVATKAMKGKRKPDFVKRLVIEAMEGEGSKVKTGLFSNWYERVKREVGLA